MEIKCSSTTDGDIIFYRQSWNVVLPLLIAHVKVISDCILPEIDLISLRKIIYILLSLMPQPS